MKFRFKTSPDGKVEVSLDGKRLEDEVIALEFKVLPQQLPHVVLVLKATDVDIDAVQTTATQTRDAAPPPPAAPAPNRDARHGKKK